MLLLLYFVIAITSILMIWQDVKFRAIDWYLFPVLALGFAGAGIKLPAEMFYNIVLINAMYLSLLLLVLTLYFSIKEHRIVNIINTWIGLGDILLMYAFCAAFHPAIFVSFLPLACLGSAALHFLIGKYFSDQKRIPLAGYLSGSYLLLALTLYILNISPYENIFQHWLI